LVAEYEELYFKTGSKDLSGYRLPELSYRRKTMETIAETCKQNEMCFTAEEFVDLWTIPFSDCVSINGWNAPTIFDILEFTTCQDLKDVSKEAVIEYIKKHFVLEPNWERLMNRYWDKAKLFI